MEAKVGGHFEQCERCGKPTKDTQGKKNTQGILQNICNECLEKG